MKNLQSYVEQKNFYRKLFNKPLYNITALTPGQAQELHDDLDNDLSPENLTCDGEVRGAALQRKSRMLHGAQAELIKMGFEPRAQMLSW
jgi:hypothetical protein